ncbi:MAG: glycoside hydrolase family 27 protein, partial [Lachnospiraceae bacterium]|nr:glycoside hydrolase family 27 protein [Lachnospiraceae bacterium]
MKNCSLTGPDRIDDNEFRFDSFDNGKVLHNKKKGRLPAMGWNSWNAFGSGNTEALTKEIVDKMIELGLDKLGYRYIVLDDGCYKPERVDGKLSNEETKFPSGFRALSDHIHKKGFKFGMYNDIGTRLCAGAYVGTCGHEREDAKSYIEWGVDFIKVDNCYYLWDNATFSEAENVRFVYAPAIASVTVTGPICESGKPFEKEFSAGRDMFTEGEGVRTEEIDGSVYFTHIGTFDGTGPMRTPVRPESGEVCFDLNADESGTYRFDLKCLTGREEGRGSWLQIAALRKDTGDIKYIFDNEYSGDPVEAVLEKGEYKIRLMNHRRQENTLFSYAKFLEGLKEADPDNDVIYSLCEWGKTQPQNWAKKVGDSWRILNDISFHVGSDGDPGFTSWTDGYTPAVTSQYNKAVVMDEFSGLDKGWNDPDMMVIGMGGLDTVQYRTHMTMWCMMNSPLMLGLDLRRVKKGDEIYNIIANKEVIDLNQDPLGIQAKRVYCSLLEKDSDREYVTNNNRVDILAKPLSDGSIAISFINVSDHVKTEG